MTAIIPTDLIKPTLGHVKLKFDLTEIVAKQMNDKYPVGEQITSAAFMIGDYKGDLGIYPSGKDEASTEHWSLFLRIIGSKSGDETINAQFYCGAIKHDMGIYPIDAFNTGWGYLKAFESELVNEKKSIKLEIKIYGNNKEQIINDKNACLKQQELVYENSLKHGDITLIIQEEQDDIDNQPLIKKTKQIQENEQNQSNNAEDKECIKMKVSSIILRSASHVFAGMMDHDFKENKEKQIEIHAQTAKDVDDMYYWICTHHLRKDVTAINVIKLAHLYDLTVLFHACTNRIIAKLDVDNYIDAANTFNRYSIEEGYEKLVEFGKKNLDEIKGKDNFQDLHFAFKFGILGCGNKQK